MQNKITDKAVEKVVEISGFQISGLQVRTRNADEADNATGKIAPLWGQFFARNLPETLPAKTGDGKIYGVYSNYENDANGLFNVTAGVGVMAASAELANVSIAAGRYMVFECEGEMPAAIIEGWGKVWSYFSGQTEYQRSYLTDFEEYQGPTQAAIYIGIK
ncbi:AraC family transcriptional regulator [Undibacterium sp. KW1]|uniref:GyrI-like domain-containing protein n=1 Tax=Undibacterium sp. KW1 TaxID=2058624 RepID=UPI001331EF68|nr:GyrI-like domain-containing protein [Undibacterium sp. KW1]BBB63443.1 AraC family transcriptional regulator [Undibacterium sp. KW1]